MTSYVEQLRLEFDPFDSSIQSAYFYPGGGRQATLDRLLELCSYGSEPGMVTGLLGSGKSTLSRWLALSLETNFVAVRVSATLFMTEIELMEAICRGLELDPGEQSGIAALTDLIEEYSSSLSGRGRTLVLIVDDAHELGEVVLQALLDLLAAQRDTAGLGEDGIKAVLFGEPLLTTTLGRLAPAGYADFELASLSDSETGEYIEFKLSSAGYRGRTPIDHDEMLLITTRSNGNPGAIDALVRSVLDEPRETPARSLPVLSFPERHLVAASVLFAVLAITLFFTLGDERDADEQVPEIAALEPNGRVQIPVALGVTDSPVDPVTPEVALAAPAELSTRPEDTVDPTGNNAPEATPEPATQVVPALPVPAPLDGQIEAAAAAVESSLEPAGTDSALVEPEAEVAVAPSQTPDRVVAGQRLASVQPEGYTLQVLGSHSEDNVLNFIARNGRVGDLAYFESRFQDRPWYVVVYGTYPSRNEARAAIDELPQPIRDLEPWARPLSDIQADISRHQ